MAGLKSFSLSQLFREKRNSRGTFSADDAYGRNSRNPNRKKTKAGNKEIDSTTEPGTSNIHSEVPSTKEITECPLCLLELPITYFPQLRNCHHKTCFGCLQQYLRIEITESRVDVTCPQCPASIHPNDIRMILSDGKLYKKYELFMLRRVLAVDPEARWCPAPDCDYVVLARNGLHNPMLLCEKPGCGIRFCFKCRTQWKRGHSCANRRAVRPAFVQQDLHVHPNDEDMKPCPSCGAPISKLNDGSCNHMKCSICGAQFCWLCLKEITEFHFFGPTGCTLWGKKPWGQTKKILWQVGMLLTAPAIIALMAGVAIPAILIGTPIIVGKRLFAKYNDPAINKHRRNLIVSGGVFASAVFSPLLAGCAVCIIVPALLIGVYVVLPMSYCCSLDLGDIEEEWERLEDRSEIEE